VAKGEVQLRPLNFESIIREVVQNYPQLQSPKLEVITTNLLPRVMGHDAYLTQVISNLLENAVKFVAPEVHPRVKISSEPDEEMVRLWNWNSVLSSYLPSPTEVRPLIGLEMRGAAYLVARNQETALGI
jgi:light-regulated signal transduction histidine kinase (bacteriophytochrome)